MPDIARRGLLAGTAAALVTPALARRAAAAPLRLKMGHNTPVNHPVHVRATEMAARVKAETGGRVDIAVFPASQLGGDTDMLSQVRLGGLDMMTIPALVLSILVPAAAIDGIGFAFPDYSAVWKAMDGDLGAYVRRQIGKAGLVVTDRIWDNGFRQITTSNKPLLAAGDLRGLKIRVPVSPLWTSMFKAFGSAPTGIGFAEVYSALQTRVVDGQENPLLVIDTTKLYEVQKYCAMTNHMWDGYWFIVNRRTWNALGPDAQGVLAAAIDRAATDERSDIQALNVGLRDALVRKGLTFNEPDRQSFQAALRGAGFYTEWKAKFGDEAWAILESTTGKLT